MPILNSVNIFAKKLNVDVRLSFNYATGENSKFQWQLAVNEMSDKHL